MAEVQDRHRKAAEVWVANLVGWTVEEMVSHLPHSPMRVRVQDYAQALADQEAAIFAEIAEDLRVGSPWHVSLWEVINEYADAGRATYGNTKRMNAVIRIEKALTALVGKWSK